MKFKLTKREIRLLIYLIVALGGVGYYFIRSWWSPTLVKSSENFTILSTADESTTDSALGKLEILYTTYTGLLSAHGFNIEKKADQKFKSKLYKSREEFRRCNPKVIWAEAYYKYPYCHQYIDTLMPSPYHGIIHEATHQLDNELLGKDYPEWLSEGFACYISTSKLEKDSLNLGEIDNSTYPIIHMYSLKLTGNLNNDIENKKFIPLNDILKGKEPLKMSKYFNLYYVHWWSLVHFLMHYNDSQYREGFLKMARENDSYYDAFRKHIGDPNLIQEHWYKYLNFL